MTPRHQIETALSAAPGPSNLAAFVAAWLKREYGQDAPKVADVIRKGVE